MKSLLNGLIIKFLNPDGFLAKLVLGQIKHWLLTVPGAALTAHGYMTGADWQTDVGAIMVLLGSAWNVGIAVASHQAQTGAPVVQSATVPNPAP